MLHDPEPGGDAFREDRLAVPDIADERDHRVRLRCLACFLSERKCLLRAHHLIYLHLSLLSAQ